MSKKKQIKKMLKKQNVMELIDDIWEISDEMEDAHEHPGFPDEYDHNDPTWWL